MMRQTSHSSASSNLTASPKNRLSFFKKRPGRDESGSLYKIFDPQPSDKISSSPLAAADLEPARSNGTLPSPDSFVGAPHNSEFLQLRENIKRLRKAPSGPDPKKVDAAWEVYKKLREESFQLCKSLLQKYEISLRNASFESNLGHSDTRSWYSGSVTEASLPLQWPTAVREYKAAQEVMLETLRTSLLSTYKAYEPEASKHQWEAFLADRDLRHGLIVKWRDTSVHRMKSEKLLFWEQYKIRSLNFEKLRFDLLATEQLIDLEDSWEAPNLAIQEHVIAKSGDTILEFANAASEVNPVLRFRVSSHLLAEASPLFSQMLSSSQQVRNVALDMINDLPPAPSRHTCKDGMEVKVYRMPQVELNNHEALTILLHAAHMHNQKVPREIDFQSFVSIAEVCLRYRCTSPLELQVEYQWLPQWMHMAGEDSPDGLLLISYAFGLQGIFTRMSKTVILNSVDEEDIQRKELWPQSVRDKINAVRSAKLAQIYECCANAIEEYFKTRLDHTDRRESVGSLVLNTVPRCPRGSHLCDATNLGWLMLVYNESKVLPSIMRNVGFHNLPKTPRRSIKELVDCLRLMPSGPQVHSGVCDYAPAFRSAINDIYNSIQGLTLKDVSGRNGWALSKHAEEDRGDDMSPDRSPKIYDLPAPKDEEKQKPLTISSHENIYLGILSRLDDIDDLNAAAMIDKGFYGAYTRNEAVLLKNVMKAVRRTKISLANPEIIALDNALRRDTMASSSSNVNQVRNGEMSHSLVSINIRPAPQKNLYNVSPTISPNIQDEQPMSAEEAHRILWPSDESKTIEHDPAILENGQPVEPNEKYLIGDVAHTEDKARMQEDTKHLRDEKDEALGLGIYKTNGPS